MTVFVKQPTVLLELEATLEWTQVHRQLIGDAAARIRFLESQLARPADPAPVDLVTMAKALRCAVSKWNNEPENGDVAFAMTGAKYLAAEGFRLTSFAPAPSEAQREDTPASVSAEGESPSPRDAAILLLLDWRMQMPFARDAQKVKAREVVERFRSEVGRG